MTEKKTRVPSAEEMDARILRNLNRLKGYIEVLLSEIDDPDKFGPGADDEAWRKEAEALDEQLDKLKAYLDDRQKVIQT